MASMDSSIHMAAERGPLSSLRFVPVSNLKQARISESLRNEDVRESRRSDTKQHATSRRIKQRD